MVQMVKVKLSMQYTFFFLISIFFWQIILPAF